MIQSRHSVALVTLSLALSCKGSDSSKSAPVETAETPPGEEDSNDKSDETTEVSSDSEAPVASLEGSEGPSIASEVEESKETESESALQLAGSSLEFQRLQFDCGNVRQPIADVTKSSLPPSLLEIRALAATIPAKDKALLTMKIQEGDQICDYRAQFAVNKDFSEIAFEKSQALNAAGVAACSDNRMALDDALSQSPLLFDYDRPFIRWVAVRIPETLQLTAACSSGPLRVVFAMKL